MKSGTLRRIGAVFALVALPVSHAVALTYEQAGENLTYLLSAQLAAKRCEADGTSVQTSFGAWRIARTKDLEAAIGVIRAKARSLDLDEDVVVSSVLRDSRSTALERLDKRSIDCTTFKAFLDDIDRHLER